MIKTISTKNNKILYYIYSSLYTVGYMFCSGTILHTFMMDIGVDEGTVAIYNAVIQFVQVMVMLAMTLWADKIRNVIKTYSLLNLSIGLISVFLILCVFVRSNLPLVKVLIFASSILVNFSLGIKGALDYRITYEILDMKNIGPITGACAAITGLVSFVVSIFYSFLISVFDYYTIMMICFGISLVLIIASTICSMSYGVVNKPQVSQQNKLDLSVLKNKSTTFLAIPNIARGIASGLIGLVTVVGLSSGILDTQSSTYLNILIQVASFIGNILFTVLCGKFKSRTILLYSSILLAIIFPFTIMNGNIYEFLIAYAISYMLLIIVNIAIPTLVYEIIPYSQIGSYSSIRLMLFTLGSVIASIIYKPLSDALGYLNLFIIASVMQIICGLGYYIVSLKTKRNFILDSVKNNTTQQTKEKI